MLIRDNLCQFGTKTYIVTPHLNRLIETVQKRVTTYGSKRNKKKLFPNYHQILLISRACMTVSVDPGWTILQYCKLRLC